MSAKTGEGQPELVSAIVELARSLLPTENQLAINRRQAECIADARESLLAASATGDVILLAESLRSARLAFDRLTGRVGVEDLLDALFGRFCLGK